MDSKTIIDRLGGPSEVARICGVTPQAVSQWYGKKPPLKKKPGPQKRRGKFAHPRSEDRDIPRAWRLFLEEVRPDAFKEPQGERAA